MSNKTEDRALKHFIDRDAVKRLGLLCQQAYPRFALPRFVKLASTGLAPLEFSARTRHVAAALAECLPRDKKRAINILKDSLPQALPQAEGMFSENFWLWPISDFICQHGVDHWDESMAACYRLTQCFTAEFAVRPLLKSQAQKTLARLLEWTGDDSEHVRRLCSEGTRPRLPWASRLELPRDEVMRILTMLKSDPSRFVQKSVANHLNDLGKDEPQWLIDAMRTWQADAGAATKWIIGHALRTQVKAGDRQALALLGFAVPKLKNIKFKISPEVPALGDSVTANLEFTNASKRTQRLLLDWVMHYARPGAQASRKVFKGRIVVLGAGEAVAMDKRFDMVPRATRKLHAGEHRLMVQINGQIVAEAGFRLREAG